MLHDDYFVVAYQILSYLYDCLKKGEEPEGSRISSAYFMIPESYYESIVTDLIGEGYMTKWGWRITHKGICYLFENPMMAKAKCTLEAIENSKTFF